MKFLTSLISKQHLYLKAIILLTGIVTGLDSSLKQLVMQAGLFLICLILEPGLYLSLFSALRRIVPFLAAYWVAATLFQTDFLVSIVFSVQLLYLILVTVWVFARADYTILAWDSAKLRRWSWMHNLFAYALYTSIYVKKLFSASREIHASGSLNQLFQELASAYQKVAAQGEDISQQVQNVLTAKVQKIPERTYADLFGLAFLAALAIIHGV